jgi:nickel transport protein
MSSFSAKSLPHIFLSLLLRTMLLYAHGTEYEILSEGVIGIKALFDTGEAMADSRVLIFAPGEKAPTFETKTDGHGIACFSPDRSGIWVLQIRDEGGHGMRINLEIDDSMKLISESTGSRRLSDGQRIAMAVCVAFGFVGTALYFFRRKQASDTGPE